jgi:hypothetical protein
MTYTEQREEARQEAAEAYRAEIRALTLIAARSSPLQPSPRRAPRGPLASRAAAFDPVKKEA